MSENDHDNYNVLNFGDLYHCTTFEKQLADRKYYRVSCCPLLEFIFFFPRCVILGFEPANAIWDSYLTSLYVEPLKSYLTICIFHWNLKIHLVFYNVCPLRAKLEQSLALLAYWSLSNFKAWFSMCGYFCPIQTLIPCMHSAFSGNHCFLSSMMGSEKSFKVVYIAAAVKIISLDTKMIKLHNYPGISYCRWSLIPVLSLDHFL